MSAPTTKTGKEFVARGSNNVNGEGWIPRFNGYVLAIEAEARAALLAELRAKVHEMREEPDDHRGAHVWNDCIAAVLVLLAEPLGNSKP